ncbi:MAG: hypothetical protein ACKVYV_13015 [Limisphaerales bacterium]
MSSSSLDTADRHALSAMQGWLLLGLPGEAEDEWARLTPSGRAAREALHLRWQLCAARCDWAGGLGVADELEARHPDDPAAQLFRAYALRRVAGGGLPRAWPVLRAAAERFPEVDTIAYNLACYAAQLGRPDEGWEWYLRATQLSGDHDALAALALADDDLRPLWPRIRELAQRERPRPQASG